VYAFSFLGVKTEREVSGSLVLGKVLAAIGRLGCEGAVGALDFSLVLARVRGLMDPRSAAASATAFLKYLESGQVDEKSHKTHRQDQRRLLRSRHEPVGGCIAEECHVSSRR
jgi:hypothetical protein